jgi:DNA topoisomerase-1
LNKSFGFNYNLTIGEKKDSMKNPPKPLNTSKLLQLSNNLLGYSPKITMQLAQNLYQEGKITYMRTDTTKYSKTFIETVKTYIIKKYGNVANGNGTKYIYSNLKEIENDAIHGTNPHEAIRVTNIFNIPTKESTPLYKLIWKHTLQSCMAIAKYYTYDLIINSPLPNEYYKYTLEIPVFLGWKEIEDTTKEKEKEKMNYQPNAMLFFLQNLSKKDNIFCNKIESNVVLRNTHKHYTESGLIQKLEELEIGRPSTYSMFVDTIQERGYVEKTDVSGVSIECHEYCLTDESLTETIQTKTFEKEKNKLVIKPIGILCIEFLLQYFNEIFEYNYTKEMELELDKIMQKNNNLSNDPIIQIETLNTSWYDVCNKTHNDIAALLKPLSKIKKTTYPIDEYNEFTFQQYGPCIKRTNPLDNTVEYYPVKRSLKIDVNKLKNGEYTMVELLEYENSILGEYNDAPLKIKTGKYGYYLEWGNDQKNITSKSLENINIELCELTLEKAIGWIEETMDELKKEMENKKIFRVLNEYTSVRQGKFGTYLYHKTPDMQKPIFMSLKKCPLSFMDCSLDLLMEWMNTKKTKSKK